MNTYCNLNCPKFQEIKEKKLKEVDSVYDAILIIYEEINKTCRDNCIYKDIEKEETKNK